MVKMLAARKMCKRYVYQFVAIISLIIDLDLLVNS